MSKFPYSLSSVLVLAVVFNDDSSFCSFGRDENGGVRCVILISKTRVFEIGF